MIKVNIANSFEQLAGLIYPSEAMEKIIFQLPDEIKNTILTNNSNALKKMIENNDYYFSSERAVVRISK